MRLQVEEDAVVGVRVSVDEHERRGTGEHAVGGDLCEEYLLVVTGYAVGVSVEDEPSTTDGVIDEGLVRFKLLPHGLMADSMVFMFPSPAAKFLL